MFLWFQINQDWTRNSSNSVVVSRISSSWNNWRTSYWPELLFCNRTKLPAQTSLATAQSHNAWTPVSDSREQRTLLGLVPLNPIAWCYIWYYVWHYVWHDVWLNIVINKVILLLSEILVTWIFEHYHIVHEMCSMWFSHREYRSQVICKLRI